MKYHLLFYIWSIGLLGTVSNAQTNNKNVDLPPEATEQWEPQPRVVKPGEKDHLPPSDAIVLFDGSNLVHWKSNKTGENPEWIIQDGIVTVNPGSGNLETKESYGDVQIHLEWRAPSEIKGEGQGRGNSGLLIMGKYEVQILDSYQNRTYSNGQAASIYKEYMPLVNAMRSPQKWNTYDVFFTAPRFNSDGILMKPAYLTVIHNGVLVHNHREIKGVTAYIGVHQYKPHPAELPFQLQDHGNRVSFRNIWVRKL
ncbi:DUF1080 domain-containing protein [Echinicola jeungdonensis]|uniref:DUF1080 domain-containing protein n=1 Tax=Echinicola jeungdonensis TaxID=709343 RepID=A0ABV5J5V2_9BACT|nr:DUF1080 domain-containing protein [Echinicola jeungdonensis]MDN3670971.1 DUF1080 domain-containing protein [Echinicola jeungdonensis]